MSIREIERRLAAANERWDQATQAVRARWQAGEVAEYWAAHDAVLVLQRELAAAKGEEYAVPLDFPLRWDRYPSLHLLCNEHTALLTFLIRNAEPGAGGASVEIVGPTDEGERSLALVEFSPYFAAKLGSPNDEVFEGHPLQGRGLEASTAQKVVNSRWLAEIEAINRVHHRYDPSLWNDRNHYIFWFHDSTFECIARSYKVEVHRESMAAMLTRMCERLAT